MTHVHTGGSTTDRPPLIPRPFRAIAHRLKGPGGFYNAGNLLGLSVALATQFVVAATSTGSSFGDRLYAYFAGSPSSVALTIATTIFLFSGETYHRAWSGRAVPSARLNRAADLLSVAGATALTLSLTFAGQMPLALASGILIVGGKLASAITCDDRSRMHAWPATWRDPFRMAVLVGRVPGLIAATIEVTRHLLEEPTGVAVPAVATSATLIVCYVLWIRADFLLLGPPRAGPPPAAPARGALAH
jgi:hypothetical protein